jgi:hypothetical protein
MDQTVDPKRSPNTTRTTRPQQKTETSFTLKELLDRFYPHFEHFGPVKRRNIRGNVENLMVSLNTREWFVRDHGNDEDYHGEKAKEMIKTWLEGPGYAAAYITHSTAKKLAIFFNEWKWAREI